MLLKRYANGRRKSEWPAMIYGPYGTPTTWSRWAHACRFKCKAACSMSPSTDEQDMFDSKLSVWERKKSRNRVAARRRESTGRDKGVRALIH